jgi:glucose-1-phosphate cytidylyltransferase
MKTVILAGGLGTRLMEETIVRPKPMVEIGGFPILWHIMNVFGAYGFNEFVLALGYKGDVIKQYFLNFHAMNTDLSLDLGTGERIVHGSRVVDWRVHLIDTGLATHTGGRLKRLAGWLERDKTFFMTYGDGLCDVNLRSLLDFHRSHGKLATVTAVRPPGRFGALSLGGRGNVAGFAEKPQAGEGWINGGFFVLDREVLDYIDDDSMAFEHEPLNRLTADGELMAYSHEGFWQPMDTLRDRRYLEELWNGGNAPWRIPVQASVPRLKTRASIPA